MSSSQLFWNRSLSPVTLILLKILSKLESQSEWLLNIYIVFLQSDWTLVIYTIDIKLSILYFQ